ncbi:hypothetical protein, partial [Mesorhizobium sp.]|uniref:hypothetical protein n=1 Tax=Mesorhizobium sp. TaxID=1871066 RepID=UPI0025DA8B56
QTNLHQTNSSPGTSQRAVRIRGTAEGSRNTPGGQGCCKPTQQQTSWPSDMESVTPRPEQMLIKQDLGFT